MPIYEYQCDGCRAVFEVFQKMSDPPPSSHSCGSTQVHRLLSNTSFVLKGTGWYKTDYADKPAGRGKAGGDERHGDAAGDKGDKAGKGDRADTGDKAAPDRAGAADKGAASEAAAGAKGDKGRAPAAGGDKAAAPKGGGGGGNAAP